MAATPNEGMKEWIDSRLLYWNINYDIHETRFF